MAYQDDQPGRGADNPNTPRSAALQMSESLCAQLQNLSKQEDETSKDKFSLMQARFG